MPSVIIGGGNYNVGTAYLQEQARRAQLAQQARAQALQAQQAEQQNQYRYDAMRQNAADSQAAREFERMKFEQDNADRQQNFVASEAQRAFQQALSGKQYDQNERTLTENRALREQELGFKLGNFAEKQVDEAFTPQLQALNQRITYAQRLADNGLPAGQALLTAARKAQADLIQRANQKKREAQARVMGGFGGNNPFFGRNQPNFQAPQNQPQGAPPQLEGPPAPDDLSVMEAAAAQEALKYEEEKKRKAEALDDLQRKIAIKESYAKSTKGTVQAAFMAELEDAYAEYTATKRGQEYTPPPREGPTAMELFNESTRNLEAEEKARKAQAVAEEHAARLASVEKQFKDEDLTLAMARSQLETVKASPEEKERILASHPVLATIAQIREDADKIGNPVKMYQHFQAEKAKYTGDFSAAAKNPMIASLLETAVERRQQDLLSGRGAKGSVEDYVKAMLTALPVKGEKQRREIVKLLDLNMAAVLEKNERLEKQVDKAKPNQTYEQVMAKNKPLGYQPGAGYYAGEAAGLAGDAVDAMSFGGLNTIHDAAQLAGLPVMSGTGTPPKTGAGEEIPNARTGMMGRGQVAEPGYGVQEGARMAGLQALNVFTAGMAGAAAPAIGATAAAGLNAAKAVPYLGVGAKAAAWTAEKLATPITYVVGKIASGVGAAAKLKGGANIPGVSEAAAAVEKVSEALVQKAFEKLVVTPTGQAAAGAIQKWSMNPDERWAFDEAVKLTAEAARLPEAQVKSAFIKGGKPMQEVMAYIADDKELLAGFKAGRDALKISPMDELKAAAKLKDLRGAKAAREAAELDAAIEKAESEVMSEITPSGATTQKALPAPSAKKPVERPALADSGRVIVPEAQTTGKTITIPPSKAEALDPMTYTRKPLEQPGTTQRGLKDVTPTRPAMNRDTRRALVEGETQAPLKHPVEAVIEFQQKTGDWPDIKNLAKRMGITKQEAINLVEAAKREVLGGK